MIVVHGLCSNCDVYAKRNTINGSYQIRLACAQLWRSGTPCNGTVYKYIDQAGSSDSLIPRFYGRASAHDGLVFDLLSLLAIARKVDPERQL